MSKLIVGVNDLVTVNPELVKEWHPTKNGELKPSDVTAGSERKVWWLGKCGHEWETVISRRNNGGGCPYCSSHKVLQGFNDLATKNPELAKEWHPTKNGELKPSDIIAGSNKKVWWLGKCGHEWEASLGQRIHSESKCPVCAGMRALSGFNDLATTHPELAKEWHPTKNGELKPSDIVAGRNKKVWWQCAHGHEWEASPNQRTKTESKCPYCIGRLAVAGETDLATTHPELAKEWHPTKNSELKPFDVTAGSDKKVWWQCAHGHEWQATIYSRNNGSGCPYCSGRLVIPGKTDLATNNPAFAREWHPSKNGNLTPEQVTVFSSKRIWWQCSKGHEWQAKLNNRSRGIGMCPVCWAENQTSFPEQAIFFYLSQLTPTENRYLLNDKTEIDIYLPEFKIGIEYDGWLYHRGRKAEKKEARKNKALFSAGITLIRIKEMRSVAGCVNTDDIIYCQYSHIYTFLKEAIENILTRLNKITKKDFALDIDIERDRGQIYSLYIANEKKNSLAVLKPELACEWHPTKNGDLKPSNVIAGSSKKVWWLGKCGHEWEAQICNRSKPNGTGCPICSGKRALPGYNDLATKNPTLAAQWHPTKNGALTPEKVTYGSNKKVWWLCSTCGHQWEACVYNRSLGKSCPACAGKVPCDKQ